MSTPIVLLGPQQRFNTLRAALDTLAPERAPLAITAGWQEEEGELDELRGLDVEDLRLYRRTEALFEAEPALFAAHRGRQTRLQTLQRYYRLRLGHAQAALRGLDEISDEPRLLAAQRRAARAALRLLDRQHLKLIDVAHAEFDTRNARLAAERERLAASIAAAGAVLIAGGHVAILIARLRLFDLGPLLATRPLIAWSAGAMTLAEKVLAFHDRPPQGPSDPEIVDRGLGLLRGLLPLPHARARLALDDAARQSALAARAAPARCVLLEPGSRLVYREGHIVEAERCALLTRRGRVSGAVARVPAAG